MHQADGIHPCNARLSNPGGDAEASGRDEPESRALLLGYSGSYHAGLVAVLLYVMPAALSKFGSPVGRYDESLQLVNGMLVASGRIPHADFRSPYAPLNYLVNAWAFRLLGFSVLTARSIQLLIYALAVLAFLWYSRRNLFMEGRAQALPLFLAVLMITRPIQAYSWNGIGLSFLAFLYYLGCLPKEARRNGSVRMGVAGLLTGITLLFKQNLGAYLAIAVLVDQATAGAAPALPRLRIARTIAYGVGVIVPASLLVLVNVVLYRIPPGTMLSELVIHPGGRVGLHMFLPLALSTQYGVAITLPFLWFAIRAADSDGDARRRLLLPLGCAILFYAFTTMASRIAPSLLLPAVAACVAGLGVLQRFYHRLDRREFTALTCYSCFLHYFFFRASDDHFAALLPFVAVLVLSVPSIRPLTSRWIALGIIGCLLISVPTSFSGLKSAFWEALHPLNRHNILASWRILTRPGPLGRTGDSDFLLSASLPLSGPYDHLYGDTDELMAAQFLAGNMAPGDNLYVGVTDHTRAATNDMRVYWVLGGHVGVRDHLFETGLTTEADIQERIIGDIEANRVGWLLLEERNDLDHEDFKPSRYTGSPLLDLYLRRHFVKARDFGNYGLYRRSI